MQYPVVGLFDADLWCYDVAFAAQQKLEDGTEVILGFDYCKDFIDIRYEEIKHKLRFSKTEMYLTGSGNFRHDIATILPYKGNRKQPKPFHYENIRAYLQFKFNAEVVHGMEADDMLSIRQCQLGDKSVIISRDKDLRMVPGWHYGYAVGKQPEQHLEHISEYGYLHRNTKGKVIGGGMMWFYFQCLVGDTTDNIQGVPKCGPVKAFNALKDCETVKELHNATLDIYKQHFGEGAGEAMLENARLLWMVREATDSGDPVTLEEDWGVS